MCALELSSCIIIALFCCPVVSVIFKIVHSGLERRLTMSHQFTVLNCHRKWLILNTIIYRISYLERNEHSGDTVWRNTCITPKASKKSEIAVSNCKHFVRISCFQNGWCTPVLVRYCGRPEVISHPGILPTEHAQMNAKNWPS